MAPPVLADTGSINASVSSYLDTDWEWQMGKPQTNMRGVWGSSSSNVFAVGDGGVIMHYDGTDWTDMDTPLQNINVHAVWGTSSY